MIRKLCYELYKVDWKYSHITKDIEMDNMKNFYEDIIEKDIDVLNDYSYEDCVYEFGYNGEVYADYDEFLDNEYQEEDYIKELLDNKKLFKLYLKDLENM